MRWLLLPALLQTQASVGLGVGTVRYAGGSSVSAAALPPAAQLTTATVVAAGGGTIAALPDNAWFGLGRLTLWGETSRLAGGCQLAGEANATGTSRTSAGPTAAAYFVAKAM